MPSAKAFALVLAVALATSLGAVRGGFVWDDVPVVRDDARIHSLSHLPDLLAVPYWSDAFADRIYRPVTTVSFALDWAAGRGSPAVLHAVNVFLHLAVTALVLVLAGRLLGGGAVVAALWFAVHPVHVEAFAPIVGRSELLAALGYLAAVLAYSAPDPAGPVPRRREAARALLTLGGAALAFGSKEHALTLPLMLLLADAWAASRSGERFRDVFRRRAVLWCGVTALAAGYLAARAAVLGTALGGGNIASGLEGLTALQRFSVMLPAFLVWLRLLAVPAHLSVDYSPNQFVPTADVGVQHVAALALLAAAAVAGWRLRRRAPAVTVGLVWAAVTAAVAANVIAPTGVLIGERVLYLPSVGAALIVGALWERLPRHALVWPATALALSLLGARSVARVGIWRTGERFLAARAADAPEAFRTRWELGAHAFDRGDAAEGEREMRAAVRIRPDDAALLQDFAFRYLAAGILVPADRFASAAFELDSTRDGAAAAAMVARTRLGALDRAAELAPLAFRPTPPPTEALLFAAIGVYDRRGETARKLAAARRGLLLYPAGPGFPLIAAEAARMLGRCGEERVRLVEARARTRTASGRAEVQRREAALSSCREAR